jgi:hypothetical protein
MGSSGASGSTGASGTTGSSVSGSSAGETQLRGMAAAGQTDESYKQAYRDCMKNRGF